MKSGTIILIFLVLLLTSAACQPEVEVYSGPSVNAGPVSISAHVNNDGEVILEGTYSHALIGSDELGVAWDVGFEVTLNKAKSKQYTLFVLYKNENNKIVRKEYAINSPFKINFSDEQWVKRIENDSNGNIVVYVEYTPKTVAQEPPQQVPVQQPPVAQSTQTSATDGLRYYYSLISSGNYRKAWSLLTSSFKSRYNNGGYQPYADWWSTVARIEVRSVNVFSENSQSANLRANIVYYYTNGQVDANDVMEFYMVYDSGSDSWLIDDAVLR